MALADYRLCDKCGTKAFYDANLKFYDIPTRDNPMPEDELIRDSHVRLDYVGDWVVICRTCAKKFRCVIDER
jgi:hypothetical protein